MSKKPEAVAGVWFVWLRKPQGGAEPQKLIDYGSPTPKPNVERKEDLLFAKALPEGNWEDTLDQLVGLYPCPDFKPRISEHDA